MNKETVKLFKQLREAPKGDLISRPDELVKAYSTFLFTRRSLKHLAEKSKESSVIFYLIPDTLEFPDFVLSGQNKRRIHARIFGKKMHTVVIDDMNVIVTAFFAKKKYLKNFKILWRTAYPPSAYSP